MATTAAVSGGTSAGTHTTISKQTLAGDFDNFLKLLTTQLANQDPLSPMDANQFTTELVQFSQVEQAIKSNDKLDRLVAAMEGSSAGMALDYLGADVESDLSAVRLGATGGVELPYSLPATVSSARLKITDAAGKTVLDRAVPLGQGAHKVAWDGRDDAGKRLAAGTYSIAFAATDELGRPVDVTTRLVGKVDAIERRDGRDMLVVDGVVVPADTIVRARRG